MTVLAYDDPDFIKKIRKSVEFGVPVLLEIGDKLDPSLDAILMKQSFVLNDRKVIRIGDKTVPIHDNFRLYITSNHTNPSLSSELVSKVNLLDFTITASALEDQLLTLVIKHERIEIENKKIQLMESLLNNRKELKTIEDQILALITTGNIMNDEKLADTLTASKRTVDEITERISEAVRTEQEINEARVQYQTVAHRAMLLYFCVADLSHVDHMYQFSLSWFLQLFLNTLSKVEKFDDIDHRVKVINDKITDAVYSQVCSAIFEKHKLLFSFLMCVRLLGEVIDSEEWKFLIRGYQAENKPTDTTAVTTTTTYNLAKNWLPDSTW